MKNEDQILHGEFVDTTITEKKKELYAEMFCGLPYEWFCKSNTQLIPQKYKHRGQYKLLIFYGIPGSGKTSFAAKICRQHLKRGIPVFSNAPISGAYKLNKNDIGKYHLEKVCLILDEAAIDFNGKDWRKLGPEINEWLRFYRHARCSLYVLSQSAEDMEVTLRRLCYGWYELHKPIFFLPLFVAYAIKRRVAVNPDTHKIDDLFEEMSPKILKLLTAKYCWGPRYFKYFDSYALKQLPTKDWELW